MFVASLGILVCGELAFLQPAAHSGGLPAKLLQRGPVPTAAGHPVAGPQPERLAAKAPAAPAGDAGRQPWELWAVAMLTAVSYSSGSMVKSN